MGLSVRAMAQALGVSKSQVQRDKDAGMPMDSVAAAQAWRLANHDMSRTVEGRIDRPERPVSPARPMTSLPPAAGDPLDEPDDLGEPDAGAGGNDTAAYRAARTEREQIRRDRERLELEKARGQLVDREEVARLRFTEFRALRDALTNLSARVSALVAVETDPIRCEQIYDSELDQILEAFANDVLSRDVMQDVEDDDDEAEAD